MLWKNEFSVATVPCKTVFMIISVLTYYYHSHYIYIMYNAAIVIIIIIYHYLQCITGICACIATLTMLLEERCGS